MEKDPELRFVCKLCDKKFPGGKSLGGHMRSHVVAAAKSAESEEKLEAMSSMKKVSSLIGGSNLKREVAELGGPSGYGLRENPKKTWRAVDSSSTFFPLSEERFCRQCGKGFQSMKALCGHMACHSEKERGFLKDDRSWTSDNPKLVMDSHSDTDAEDLKRQTRSKSKRYNKMVVKSSNFNNSNNGSSCVSETDELEQEEAARSLMMLFRDSWNRGGVNSVEESSVNNSVVLETKSSSIGMKIVRKGCLRFDDDTMEMKKLEARKLKLEYLDGESDQFENSYSGCLKNGMKKVKSDILVDELLRNGEFKKNPKVRAGGRVEVADEELGKGYNRGKSYEIGLRKGLTKERWVVETGTSSKSKRKRDGYDSSGFRKESSKKMVYYDSLDEELSKNARKRSKYECLNCNKTFNSHQALGGHRPCHKKMNSTIASTTKVMRAV